MATSFVADRPLLTSVNSSDLHESQERPLAKEEWTCPPQHSPTDATSPQKNKLEMWHQEGKWTR